MQKRVTFSGAGTAMVAVLCTLMGLFTGYHLHRDCDGNQISIRDTIVIHDTIPGDSIPYLVVRYYPKWDTIVQTQQGKLVRIDTAAILAEYYETKYYSDTITDDTSFLAIINEGISENKITEREYWHRNLRPKVVNTTTILQEPRWRAGPYIGYGPGVNGHSSLHIGAIGTYRIDGMKPILSGSLGTDGVRIGLMWPIKGLTGRGSP